VRRPVKMLALWLALGASAGCDRNQEPPPAPAAASDSAAARPKAAGRQRRPRRGADRAAAAASPSALTAPAAAPELFFADGGLLPQTEQLPDGSSPSFQARAALLFRAIVNDDPQAARPVFFPRVAYRQVKASANPDRDYDRRLLAAFDRDIHAYHEQLGKNPDRARLLELWVPEDGARWMKPGSEGNKLGYFRVLRAQLRYLDADGKPQRLEITSLISWRGEWYVVHLDGFD
jgi:hypothetical protein